MIDWQPIETLVEEKERVLLWVVDSREPRAVFGRTYKYSDGAFNIRGEGLHGNWEFSHWAEINVPASVDRNPEGGDGTAPSQSDESAVGKAETPTLYRPVSRD